MPDFAKHIEITRQGQQTSLRIDGKEIPWYVGEEIKVRLAVGEMPSVTLSIPAERVTSDDNLEGAGGMQRCNCAEADGCSDCPKAPASPAGGSSMLDAAKLSLKEAERLEGEAEKPARVGHNPKEIRSRMHDELLLANVQASIAVAEALAASPAPAFGALVAAAQADIEAHDIAISETAYVEALRGLQASPAQEASWASAITDALEAKAQELRQPHSDAATLHEARGIEIAVHHIRGRATCACDGVNSGCSRPECPSRGE